MRDPYPPPPGEGLATTRRRDARARGGRGQEVRRVRCPRLRVGAGHLAGERAFLAFLDHLADTLPADVPTVIVLDNVGYHKSHMLRARWQALSERFFPLWLPAYAPQRNLIERVWHFLKAKLSNHRWWNDLGRLREATQTLLDLLEARFHTEDRPAFRLRQDFCCPA